MKKKLLFKKIVALLCCIAMCIPAGVLGASAVAPDGAAFTLTMQVSPDISIWRSGTQAFEATGGDWVTPPKANYQYQYVDGKISFAALSGDTLDNKTITIFARTQDESVPPEIVCDAGLIVDATVGTYIKNVGWRITLAFTAEATSWAEMDNVDDVPVELTCGVQKYNVTIPATGTYRVTWGNGIEVNSTTHSFEQGTSARFRVQAYKTTETCVVEVMGEELEPDDQGYYTIKDIQENITVSVTVKTKEFKVTVKDDGEGRGYTYTQSSNAAAYNNPFEFKVVPTVGYDKPEVAVTVGDNTVTPVIDGNVYTIPREAVTGDIVISINGKPAKTYKAQVVSGTGYTGQVTGDSHTYGSKVEYTITPNDGYEITSINLRMSGADYVVTVDNEGKYSFEITGDATITATAQPKDFDVTFECEQNVVGKAFTLKDANNGKVTYNQYVEFYVYPCDGYNAPNVVTKVGEKEITLTANGNLYRFQVKGNTTVTITDSGKSKYTVQLPTGADYKASFVTLAENSRFEFESEVEFKVVPNTGYDVSVTAATPNGDSVEVTTLSDDQYSVKVGGNTIISVVATKKPFNVTFTTKDNGDNKAFTVTGGDNKTVLYNEYVEFNVTPGDGYNAPIVMTKVGEKETTLTPNGNLYRFQVEGETEVVIKATSKRTYTVSVNPDSKFNVAFEGGETNVEDGGSVKFTVTASNPEQYDVSDLTVTATGATVTNDGDNQYTISNVKSNVIVTITGVKTKTYRVTLQSGEGYTLTSSETPIVSYGGEFGFQFARLSGWTGDPEFVDGNNQRINVDNRGNGNYIISNVTANITISVNGLTASTYDAEVTGNENADVVADSGSLLTGIAYGDTCKFTVTAKPGYRVEQVAINGEEKNAVGGVYTVSNVTQNFQIQVVTKENQLTINYVSDEDHHTPTDSIKTVGYTAIADGAVLSFEFVDPCVLHKPVENYWFLPSGEQATPEELQKLVETSDNAVTLTAKFKTDYETAIRQLVELQQTDYNVTKLGEDKYEFSFGTQVNKKSCEADSCLSELAEQLELVAFGSILGRYTNAKLELGDVKDTVVKLNTTGTTQVVFSNQQQAVIYCHAGTELNLTSMEVDTLYEYINGQYLQLDVASRSDNPNVAVIGFMVLGISTNSDLKVVLVSDAARPGNDVPALETEV